MTAPHHHRSAPESGTATLELVIVAPMIFAIMALIFACGLFSRTENVIDQTARDSARAATAQNDRGEVQPLADKVTAEGLRSAPASCRDSASVSSEVSSGAFGLPDVGDPTAVETVSVTVTCVLDLSELAFIPFRPVTVTRTFTSPLDRFRGYQQ